MGTHGSRHPLTRAHAPGRTFYSWPAHYYADADTFADMLWDGTYWGIDRSRESPWLASCGIAEPLSAEDMLRALRRSYREMVAASHAVVIEMLSSPGFPLRSGGRVSYEFDARAAVAVHEGTAATLVEFAKADQREDFDWLAAASGVSVEDRAVLWDGTRRRLGKT